MQLTRRIENKGMKTCGTGGWGDTSCVPVAKAWKLRYATSSSTISQTAKYFLSGETAMAVCLTIFTFSESWINVIVLCERLYMPICFPTGYNSRSLSKNEILSAYEFIIPNACLKEYVEKMKKVNWYQEKEHSDINRGEIIALVLTIVGVLVMCVWVKNGYN